MAKPARYLINSHKYGRCIDCGLTSSFFMFSYSDMHCLRLFGLFVFEIFSFFTSLSLSF